MKTFEAVRGHFQELYRKLFGGGKADVFLENEADVLESGIEVVARPPGKQLQRISLLSGGEKTMTAVALLLAIFRARPSPFCILDEVDAALDESNVDRFTSLVREFLDQSQFVVITHNKRTMSMADVLYGVTMGEPGVSRKVSVKFSDMHEKGYIAVDEKQPRRGRQAAAPAAVVAPETSAALAALGSGHASAPAAAPVAEPAFEPAGEPVSEPAAEAAGYAQSSPVPDSPAERE
jgi:ABC-type multidrug transport system ATPase subunit